MSLCNIRRLCVVATATTWLLAGAPVVCAFLNTCRTQHNVRPSKSSALNENAFSNMFKSLFNPLKPGNDLSENIQSLEESQAEMMKFLNEAEAALNDADDLLQSLIDDEDENHRLSRNDGTQQSLHKSDTGHDKKDNERDWSKFTVAQLKEELKTRGLPVSGRRADLISRLENFAEVVDDNAKRNDIVQQEVNREETAEEKDFSTMTVAQLKVELKSRGLPVAGKKADLISRLVDANHGIEQKENLTKTTNKSKEENIRETPESEVPDKEGSTTVAVETDWSKMTVKQLKVELKSHGLPVSGKKGDLISRLIAVGEGNKGKINAAKIMVVSEGRNGRDTHNEEENTNEDSTTVAVDADLSKLTVAQLRAQLRKQGLPVSGKKAALISRLVEH